MKRTTLLLAAVLIVLIPLFANAANLTFITFTVQQTPLEPSGKIESTGHPR